MTHRADLEAVADEPRDRGVECEHADVPGLRVLPTYWNDSRL